MTALHDVCDGGLPARGPSVATSGPAVAAPDPLGITISPVALGAWGLAADDWGGVPDGVEARRTIERALDVGITCFDTAPSYGRGVSESLLGLVLGAPGGAARRDGVVLATKCGPHDDPRTSLESSLRRLRTDHVELLQLHEMPREPGALERRLERMHALVESGIVRAIGVCNATARELARALDVAPLATCQGPYNLLDRDAEHDVLPLTRARQLAFLAYRPLASGLLAGKYESAPRFAAGDHRARIHWFRGREFMRRQTVLDRLRPLARERGLTLAQLALAWTLARPGITAVLAGARTATQVEENAVAARTPLSAADVAAIDAAVSRVYAPRALRRNVEVIDPTDGSGRAIVRVRDGRIHHRFDVGAREAYVMRRLDGRTRYAEIAAGWEDDDGRRLLAAQVILLVDQLADLGLLEEGSDVTPACT